MRTEEIIFFIAYYYLVSLNMVFLVSIMVTHMMAITREDSLTFRIDPAEMSWFFYTQSILAILS